MELRHLETFRAVAGTLSFTRAATQLGYVQSAATVHVKTLEAELGVRLFDRLGRGIVLTDAGRELLDYATRIGSLVAEASSAVAQPSEPAGTVTVSAPEVLCAHRLPSAVKELHRRHPAVQVHFRANPTGALDTTLRHALGQGEVDVAFVLAEHLAPAAPLAVEQLTEEPLVLVAAPAHPLTRARTVTAKNLDGVPMLMTEKGCPYRMVIESALSQAGVEAHVAGEFTSSEAVKRGVETGTTVGVLAAVSVAEELTRGSLVALAWRGPDLRVASYLVWSTERWISPALAALLEVTRQTLITPLVPHSGGRANRAQTNPPEEIAASHVELDAPKPQAGRTPEVARSRTPRGLNRDGLDAAGCEGAPNRREPSQPRPDPSERVARGTWPEMPD